MSRETESIVRDTTRVVRRLLHDERMTGSLGEIVERWTDNGQMLVGGSGIYEDAFEAFFDSPDGRYGLSVVVRVCDRKGGNDASA